MRWVSSCGNFESGLSRFFFALPQRLTRDPEDEIEKIKKIGIKLTVFDGAAHFLPRSVQPNCGN